MEIFCGQKMVSLLTVCIVLSTFLCTTSHASFCVQGKEYFQQKLEICVNCSTCDPLRGEVVYAPCELHHDTICGPISEVIERIAAGGVRKKQIETSPPTRHPHRHQHLHRTIINHTNDNRNNKDELHLNMEELKAAQTSQENGGYSRNDINDAVRSERPFTRAESLVWDWQAIAFSSAVFACILFFLAITLYSLHQAKQWRRLKDTFDADVEELSARLSLMAAVTATSNDLGTEILIVEDEQKHQEINNEHFNPTNRELQHQQANLNRSIRVGDGHNTNSNINRCVYLEQLLNDRNEGSKRGENGRKCAGNVYIENGNK